MRWTFELPGPVPSGNHAYKIVRIKRGTGTFMTLAKTEDAKRWQEVATLITKTQRPPGWDYSGGYLRINYEFFLKRNMDVSDNAQKLLNDAIKWALGVDDRWFLTCVKDKHVGPKVVPRIIVEIDDGVTD